MKQIKVNPNNEKYYSSEFIKGFNCGAQRQFEADMADRKDNPSSSEKPNNSTISKMEQVDKDINVRSKDEPQTDVYDYKGNGKRERSE